MKYVRCINADRDGYVGPGSTYERLQSAYLAKAILTVTDADAQHYFIKEIPDYGFNKARFVDATLEAFAEGKFKK
jgi:hypothetical protein